MYQEFSLFKELCLIASQLLNDRFGSFPCNRKKEPPYLFLIIRNSPKNWNRTMSIYTALVFMVFRRAKTCQQATNKQN